ncbi:MAG: glycosyltransferase family 2 protein [Bryobacteraceae bacterium]|nr:glycosyltransferase family 2 protein [Bryobacteraceae bacterium]
MNSRGEAPRVSAITVVKDGERLLADAIRSILAQTLPPAEILVVDGQSVDHTARVARSFPEVRYLLQPGQGLAAARNLGIQESQGDLIAFLDHDDLWDPRKLELQVQTMRLNPSLGYTTTWMKLLPKPREGDAVRDGCTPSALVARRELFSRIGSFDPQYAIGCDADWFTRARDHHVPTAVVPRILLYKRLHDANLSANAAVNRREMFHIAKRSIARRRGGLHGEDTAYPR